WTSPSKKPQRRTDRSRSKYRTPNCTQVLHRTRPGTRISGSIPMRMIRMNWSQPMGTSACRAPKSKRSCAVPSTKRSSLWTRSERVCHPMYGVSKISSEQNILLPTFPGARYSAQRLAEHLEVFARAGIVVDMTCQSAPRGTAVDFSFTTSYDNFTRVMQALPAAAKAHPPLVSGGYSKINLFGEEMVTSCGV